MELDALAQLERPSLAVVRHAPGFRQLRNHFEIVVDIEKAIVDGEDVIGVVAGFHVGGSIDCFSPLHS
jgi:hypothetical protein